MQKHTSNLLGGLKNHSRLVALVAVLVILISLPAWGGTYVTNLLILVLLYTAIGQMWNLLGG